MSATTTASSISVYNNSQQNKRKHLQSSQSPLDWGKPAGMDTSTKAVDTGCGGKKGKMVADPQVIMKKEEPAMRAEAGIFKKRGLGGSTR